MDNSEPDYRIGMFWRIW